MKPIVTTIDELKTSVISAIEQDIKMLIAYHKKNEMSPYKTMEQDQWKHFLCGELLKGIKVYLQEDDGYFIAVGGELNVFTFDIQTETEVQRMCNTTYCSKRHHCWRWVASEIYKGPKEVMDLWPDCINNEYVNFVPEKAGDTSTKNVVKEKKVDSFPISSLLDDLLNDGR